MGAASVTDTATVEGVRLFAPAPSLRRFAPSDVIRLILGVGALLTTLIVGVAAKGTIDGIEDDIVGGVTRLPDTLEQIGIGAAQLFATLVPLFALVAILWRRHWRLLLHVFVGSLVAGVVVGPVIDVLGTRTATDTIRSRAIETDTTLVAADFPTSSYVAAAVGAVTVGAPYLPRRWRRAAWAWIAVLILLRFLGPGQPPLDVLIAASIGSIVGSLVLLLLGSPNSEPAPADVLAGLHRGGMQPVAIEREETAQGSVHYIATDAGGSTAFVSVRTPDDRNWDLLNRAYRAIRLRSSEVKRPHSSLKRRVEHEALVMRTARDRGVAAPTMIGIGTTPDGAVLLAQELVRGRTLADLTPDEIDADVTRAVFEQVALLQAAHIAHNNLTLDNFVLDTDRRVRLLDFDAAELSADERELSRDVAEILVAVGTVITPEATVDAAVDVIGPEPVSRSLPLIQPLALSGTLGRKVRRQRGMLDALRAAIHDRTGADDVPLERLARVRPKTLVMILAGALAFYSLLPQFGNLEATVDAFADARWQWVPAMVGAMTMTWVFATLAFLSAVAQPLSVAPAGRCQVAGSFAQLVGPAGSGRMALAGRFLQRNGLTGAEASASVAMTSISGVVTHLTLMVGFFAWAGGADIGGFSLPSIGTLVLVAVGAIVLLSLAIAVPYTRHRIVMPVIDGLRTAAGYSTQVLRSPLRIAGLLGGTAGVTLSYLVGAVCAVEAFGGGISFAQIGAAYLAAAALANVAPTPGGLGPLEAAMIAALTGFGLDGGVAISTVLTFRLMTFWLPILPGWLSFLWMERRGEI